MEIARLNYRGTQLQIRALYDEFGYRIFDFLERHDAVRVCVDDDRGARFATATEAAEAAARHVDLADSGLLGPP